MKKAPVFGKGAEGTNQTSRSGFDFERSCIEQNVDETYTMDSFREELKDYHQAFELEQRESVTSKQIQDIKKQIEETMKEINESVDTKEGEIPLLQLLLKKDPKTIFEEITRLDELAQSLPNKQGFLLKMPLGKNALLKKPKKVWCQIKNKKFKYYRDGPTKKELSGTIDFDMV